MHIHISNLVSDKKKRSSEGFSGEPRALPGLHTAGPSQAGLLKILSPARRPLALTPATAFDASGLNSHMSIACTLRFILLLDFLEV